MPRQLGGVPPLSFLARKIPNMEDIPESPSGCYLWHSPRMTHLRLIEPDESTGELREIYQRMRARPAPAVYRPSHGGLAGIIRAHSLDAQLMARDGVYAGMFRRQASGYA